MRFPILALAVVLATACAPAKPGRKIPAAVAPVTHSPSSPTAPVAKATEAASAPVVLPPVENTSPANGPRVTSRDISGITFEGVAFDSRTHRLRVVDQAGSPGSRFTDSASAGRSVGGIAAVNAGFFTPEGAPLGLLVSSGKVSGSWNGSSLGSGVWYENTSGGAGISRREKLGRSGAAAMRESLQAGPMLVENGRAVGGLDRAKASVRMMILWDGGSRWWIGRGSTSTLAELSTALSSGGPAGWPVRHALNLDGGRSSDLWISEAVSGGPMVRRAPWNRPVRNFLVLVGK
ncbi:MAG: hypothetical protein EOP87_14870 [Verrucomicrobiaceae bacterium]|nr:MAG: hypothetical protein EOP87_14870 [Verrucomicrobiaceae bacterium]